MSQALKFISSLEYTLSQGLPQEKLVAVRQCVERIWIDHNKRKIKIQLFTVPACNIKQLDRLTHKVHIIEANGASYRLEQSRRRLARRKKTTE